jgi:hypothetical protein
MTVKELKELLSDAPEDMRVFVGDITHLGMFCFKEACICDSGVSDFGPENPEEGETGKIESGFGFVLMPHGLTVEEGEEVEEKPEDLN